MGETEAPLHCDSRTFTLISNLEEILQSRTTCSTQADVMWGYLFGMYGIRNGHLVRTFTQTFFFYSKNGFKEKGYEKKNSNYPCDYFCKW